MSPKIKALMATELSQTDIQHCIPGVPVTSYSDLASKTLNDILDSEGRGIIYFEEASTPQGEQGHWLAVLRGGDGVLVFDPYGGIRDPWYLDHTWLKPGMENKLHESRPELVQLIIDAGLKTTYNTHRLQKMAPGINTCGRHCVSRLLHSQMDNHAYTTWALTGGNADVKVTLFTQPLLQ